MHALGSIPDLLCEIGRDPAKLIWLDGYGSHKRTPNENYAREVMELFTTGPYTAYSDGGGEIRPVLRALFRSDAFYAEAYRERR